MHLNKKNLALIIPKRYFNNEEEQNNFIQFVCNKTKVNQSVQPVM